MPSNSTIQFQAQGKFSDGSLRDVTSPPTLWTSNKPPVLQSLGAGLYSAPTPGSGCACIKASNGGVASPPIGIAVLPDTCPSPCATPSPAPTAAAVGAPARSAATTMAESGGPLAMGVLQWRFNAGAAIRGTVETASDGTIACYSADGFLHALKPDGTELFRRGAGGPLFALSANTIYMQGNDGRIHALGTDGSERWSTRVGPGTGALGVAADGALYAAASGGVVALDSAGQVIWRSAIGTVGAAALVSDGGLVAGVTGDAVIAFDAHGVQRWSFAPAGGFSGRVAAASDGSVYVGSAGGAVYALDSHGIELWHFASPSPVVSGPAQDGAGGVYFGSDVFYALDVQGMLRLSLGTIAPSESAPVVLGDGAVIVGAADGTLSVINQDLSFRWSGKLGGPVRSTAAAVSGLLYVGSDDGYLYAVRYQ